MNTLETELYTLSQRKNKLWVVRKHGTPLEPEIRALNPAETRHFFTNLTYHLENEEHAQEGLFACINRALNDIFYPR